MIIAVDRDVKGQTKTNLFSSNLKIIYLYAVRISIAADSQILDTNRDF